MIVLFIPYYRDPVVPNLRFGTTGPFETYVAVSNTSPYRRFGTTGSLEIELAFMQWYQLTCEMTTFHSTSHDLASSPPALRWLRDWRRPWHTSRRGGVASEVERSIDLLEVSGAWFSCHHLRIQKCSSSCSVGLGWVGGCHVRVQETPNLRRYDWIPRDPYRSSCMDRPRWYLFGGGRRGKTSFPVGGIPFHSVVR